ncbi:hypothetical protein ACP4OV_027545 [Aristida adscensionis]
MSSTGVVEASPPATVKIIETVHIEADRSSFKSVVQRLTGRDAVVVGRPPWRGEPSSKQEAAQGQGTVVARREAAMNPESISWSRGRPATEG